GYRPADQGNVIRLPFARTFRCNDPRFEKPVDTADHMTVRLHAVVVFDLGLVAPAKVNPAVATLRIPKLEMELEIREFLFSLDVAAGLAADQKAVFGRPVILAACSEFPSG